MDWHELNIESGGCVANDETLTAHVHSALARGLPVLGQHVAHDIVAVLVGSGPSVAGQLDSIRRQRERGRPIIAIKDAHDWLIDHDIVPDFAVAIDPQEHRWNCFSRKHPTVRYLIASQCHPAMFEHLAGHQVWLWHINFNNGKAYPPKTMLINGATTTGLRTITLLYTMGYRRFELYGYDSCLQNGVLRVNGSIPPPTQTVIPIKVGGHVFLCNPNMAVQAEGFQKILPTMPDIAVQAYGKGLIAAILDERAKAQTRGPLRKMEVVHA